MALMMRLTTNSLLSELGQFFSMNKVTRHLIILNENSNSQYSASNLTYHHRSLSSAVMNNAMRFAIIP